MLFAVRLVDLSAIKALDLTGASNAEIVERLRQVFDFLPKETKIEVTDDGTLWPRGIVNQGRTATSSRSWGGTAVMKSKLL